MKALTKSPSLPKIMNERSFIMEAAMDSAKTQPARQAPNRDRILKAACSLFRTQGFHGTSTREISEKAGVSLGNIYNHFKTKAEPPRNPACTGCNASSR